jgi:cytochrome c
MTRHSPARFVCSILPGITVLIILAGLSAVRGQVQPDGETLFEKRCAGCHSLDRDKEGPHLRGVYGRRAASIMSFEYSDALKRSGITWTEEMLDRWLRNPEAVAPGNDMDFHVADAQERRQIISYLKQNPGK